MTATYKVLSALLSYPERALQEAAPEFIAALSGERLLPSRNRSALIGLLNEIAKTDLLEAQAQYVELFDRTRSLSLHLFEHVHGESRDRGQAMVSLLERYQTAGLEIAANELPDYLPLFLEFLSVLDPQSAREMLADTSHILEALSSRLLKRQSSYIAIFEALAALAGPQAEVGQAAEDGDLLDNPNDFAALDRIWEEAEVRFGPGDAQVGGCPRTSEMLVKMVPKRSQTDAESTERLDS